MRDPGAARKCAILRELADRNPRNRELQRHLSIGLGRLARTKWETGDFDGALADQEELLALSRKLRSRRSSRADRIADAETLASVADLRFEVGDNEGALVAYEELLPIERELRQTCDPSDARLQWNLFVHFGSGWRLAARCWRPSSCSVGL